jgi:hypothetical protein
MASRPCETCRTDTLHLGLTCNHCGTIAEAKRMWGDIQRDKHLARVKRHGVMKARMMQSADEERIACERREWERTTGNRLKDSPHVHAGVGSTGVLKSPRVRRHSGKQRTRV